MCARHAGSFRAEWLTCTRGAGPYFLFDLNMKPNLTGPGRPGRGDQDSLVTMASASIGWDYTDFLMVMLTHSWKPV